jgi:hypothetical protein
MHYILLKKWYINILNVPAIKRLFQYVSSKACTDADEKEGMHFELE